MVLECQQHPDYQTAIQTLLDLAEEYGGHVTHITQGGTGTVKDARSGLRQAEGDLKVRVPNFVISVHPLTTDRPSSSDLQMALPPTTCGRRSTSSTRMLIRMRSFATGSNR